MSKRKVKLHAKFRSNAALVLYLLFALLLAAPIAPLAELHASEVGNLLIYGLVTAALIRNTFLRAPPVASDSRAWVWVLCGFSSFYWLLYDLGPLHWAVLLLHWAGDIGLLYLGKSFAVLPALRQIRSSGPYRWLRHPVYATYLLADVVCIISYHSWQNAAVMLMGALSLLGRIGLEEKVLVQSPEYRRYMARTPFRLIPGMY